MSQTPKQSIDVLTALADNNVGAIAPVNIRDAYVSSFLLFASLSTSENAVADAQSASWWKFAKFTDVGVASQTAAIIAQASSDQYIRALLKGQYEISYSLSVTPSASGLREFCVRVNGTGDPIKGSVTQGNSTETFCVSTTFHADLDTNSTLELFYRTSAGNMTVEYASFTARKIG